MMPKGSKSVSELAGLNNRRPLLFLFSVGNLVAIVSTDICAALLR